MKYIASSHEVICEQYVLPSQVKDAASLWADRDHARLNAGSPPSCLSIVPVPANADHDRDQQSSLHPLYWSRGPLVPAR